MSEESTNDLLEQMWSKAQLFRDCERADVSVLLEEGIAKIKQLEADKARLVKAAERVAVWFENAAEKNLGDAEKYRGRFDNLAEACECDAENYNVMAADLRKAINATGRIR